MTYTFRFLLPLIVMFITPPVSKAQETTVKTNLLYWASTTPNIGVEAALGPKLTIGLTAACNPWNFNRGDKLRKLQHWIVMPEVRFWPYEKFDGHFLGIHGFFGSYNMGGLDIPVGVFSELKDSRYQGYGVGTGLSYGYQWYLGPHWNLEASAAIGYAYLNYDRHECLKCGESLGRRTRHYFGPTRLAVSFVYLFRSKNK